MNNTDAKYRTMVHYREQGQTKTACVLFYGKEDSFLRQCRNDFITQKSDDVTCYLCCNAMFHNEMADLENKYSKKD